MFCLICTQKACIRFLYLEAGWKCAPIWISFGNCLNLWLQLVVGMPTVGWKLEYWRFGPKKIHNSWRTRMLWVKLRFPSKGLTTNTQVKININAMWSDFPAKRKKRRKKQKVQQKQFSPDTMSSFNGRAQSRIINEWQPSMATTVKLWGLFLGGFCWLATRLSFSIRSSRTSTWRYSRASVKEQGAPGSFWM